MQIDALFFMHRNVYTSVRIAFEIDLVLSLASEDPRGLA